MNTQFETKNSGNVAGKDEWLTPPEIIKACGEFDLDPCSPIHRPWDTAKRHYHELNDGLMLPWDGRVWCNPPYGKQLGQWLEKCAMHGDCVALTFARTETKAFHQFVWPCADALFFFEGRLQFYHVNGTRGDTAGAPSVLIAYGSRNADAIKNCGLKGRFVSLK